MPSDYFTDVYDGQLWHDWKNVNIIPFLDVPGNLHLMMNIDWFQPYKHAQYSVGVIYLVIQNLPRAIWFKPENIIIVSTIPGPSEPDCNHLNSYLKPMVDDLQILWDGVAFKVPHSVFTKLVRAALVYISSDLPATMKLCGFYGFHANYGCSKCLRFFPTRQGMTIDYSGFNCDTWPKRRIDEHLEIANRAKAATTKQSRVDIEHEAGVRYSQLL